MTNEAIKIDGMEIENAGKAMTKCNGYLAWLRRMADRVKAVMNEQGVSKASDINWYAVRDLDAVTFEGHGDTYAINALAEGCEPVLRLAYRYGMIPESGDSYNYRDNYREDGVSTVGRCAEQVKRSSYYESFFGDQPYNVVMGWDFGGRGSDGEMLLVGAVVVGEAEKVEIKKWN